MDPSPLVCTSNVALKKMASATSSDDVARDADKAFDGDATTRWSSTYEDANAITVDLGSIHNISRVKLMWEAAYGKGYDIQVSTNNNTWTTAYSTVNGDGGTDDISIAATKARFVRLNGTLRGTEWGYSLFEFEVYGVNTGEPGSSSSSSSSSSSGNGSANCGLNPVALNASSKAKNLLCYLKNNTYISGQTDVRDAEQVRSWTGKYPAIVAFDFYHHTTGNTSGTQDAINWARANKGIVAFQWHWKCPRGGEFYGDCAFDQDMNNTGSKLYQDIDLIGRELKKLGDAGIPVLFRPLHEANDNYMWWAKRGTANYKRLWKIIFDRVNAAGANNVIWVFNGMSNTQGHRTQMRDWYPGDNMADVVSSDYFQARSDYDLMRGIGSNKVIGIAETFNALDPSKDAPFSFSVVWAFRDCYQQQGKPETGDVKGCQNSWRAAMSNPKTITIDKLPDMSKW
jgi:hypothetical protein